MQSYVPHWDECYSLGRVAAAANACGSFPAGCRVGYRFAMAHESAHREQRVEREPRKLTHLRFRWGEYLDWHKLAIPQLLLLVDSVGAMITSVVTGFLLTTIVPTGLPNGCLFALAAVAACFACFDVYALFHKRGARWPLVTIGLLNLAYCVATLIVCMVFSGVVTTIGVGYFVMESAVVLPLAIVEITVARRSCASS